MTPKIGVLVLRLFRRIFLEIQAERYAELIQLLIWFFAGIVLVLVVRIELQELAQWKEASGIDCRITPFFILALVEELDAGVWGGMIGEDCKPPFNLQAVAIAPRDLARLPIEIGAVPVREEKPRLYGKVEVCDRFHEGLPTATPAMAGSGNQSKARAVVIFRRSDRKP